MHEQAGEITQALLQAGAGDEAAANRLWELVYDELRRIAQRELQGGLGGGTLSSTALVHEAYLKLIDRSRVTPQDRTHFFALSCRAMRQVLVDYARRRKARKRGGDYHRLPLDQAALSAAEVRADSLLALDEALGDLAAYDARLVEVVECRYFGGLTIEETAQVLGTSPRTVERDWARAKAYLYQMLHRDEES